MKLGDFMSSASSTHCLESSEPSQLIKYSLMNSFSVAKEEYCENVIIRTTRGTVKSLTSGAY